MINVDVVKPIVRIAFILLGFPFFWMCSTMLAARVAPYSRHVAMILEHVMFYGGCLLLFFLVLPQLGIDVSALLGAAGIVGIAIGFAAQTGIGNIISGIFLLLENHFKIGDTIEIDSIVGKIEAIDLFAVQLRTDDNQLVRIPNESLIKKNVINKTFFDIRRVTFIVSIGNEWDSQMIFSTLNSIAQSQKLVLKDPAPFLGFESLSPFSNHYIVHVWMHTDQVAYATSSFMEQCLQEFNTKQIPVYVFIKDCVTRN